MQLISIGHPDIYLTGTPQITFWKSVYRRHTNFAIESRPLPVIGGKVEFGKKYDLIYEDEKLISKQYQTDVGPIDILARDKKTKNYVVIELKKNQTSDDTIGQLLRYMGWIKKNKKDDGVKGVIVAGQFDTKLDHAKSMILDMKH